MNVLISGGTGFLGRALTRSFLADGHSVVVLARGAGSVEGARVVRWDARTTRGWADLIEETDVALHLAGQSLSTFPWTASIKRKFYESRVLSGRALTEAIRSAKRRPKVFVQASGINYYGTRGETADESTPPGDDFLARLTVDWEDSTRPLEELGVRHVAIRTAVVLDKKEGMFPLMALPVKLFAGGPIGGGKFAVPWIHLADYVGAVRYLTADENARGAYNLVAPIPVSNAEFNRALAKALRRPYWLPTPAFPLRILLGEMSVLILEGRSVLPKRLLEAGYVFQFPDAPAAFADLFAR